MSDYSDSGFDSFLSRSIDNFSQTNLDSQGPTTTAQAYDRTQVSGFLGDSLRLGLVQILGRDGVIQVVDMNRETAIKIGDPNDPGQLLINKGAIYVYDRDKNPTIINGRLVGSKTLDKYTLINTFTSHVGVADDGIEWLPTPLNFTIPDGVTLIKLTLACGAAVEGTNINNHFNAIYVNDTNFKATSSAIDDAKCLFVVPNTNNGSNDIPGTSFWYITVSPGQVKNYYLGVLTPFASSATISATTQTPLVFMAEIA